MNAELDQDSRRHSEAAKWVARMQRPDAERYRFALNAWLAADRAHLIAYNKASARFQDAKILSRSDSWGPVQHMECLPKKNWLVVAASAAIVVTVSAIWFVVADGDFRAGDGKSVASIHGPYQARADNIYKGIARKLLPDGTWATLDAGSNMRVSYSDRRRDIWLESGRARFAVAHEGRPFIVHAGDGTITATGTLFDVAVEADGRVRVSLLEGGVEVRPRIEAKVAPLRMQAGHMIQFARTTRQPSISLLDRHERGWVDGMMEFDAAPLSTVVAAANRYGSRPLRVEEADLASMPISGRFRINAPDRLAENLAATLDLNVQREASGEIILRRKISSAP